MSTDAPRANDVPRPRRRYVGEIVMALVVAIAGVVFLWNPRYGVIPHVSAPRDAAVASRDSVAERVRADALRRSTLDSLAQARSHDPEFVGTPSATHAIDVAHPGEHEAARALTTHGPALSPTAGFPDTLHLDAAYRAREQGRCVEWANGSVSAGGQGTGTSVVYHTGMADDSLAYDGVARSTTGRSMVWRCTIATKADEVGRMSFTPADSVPGLILQWNAVAALDDYVLRRCMVRAQRLFTNKTVLPRASGRRHDNEVRLEGGAEGGGLSQNYSCQVTVDGDSIVALEAHVGG